MKLIIASNNKHKIREIKAILGDKFAEILSISEAGIAHETVEDGETFMENARKKAREIAEISGCAALADDSGICVDALGGAPGIYSARFAGEEGGHADDEANNDLLLEKLSGITERDAHYTCAMVIAYPDGSEISAEGYMYGEILTERHGTGGFGYDPIFKPQGYSVSVGEITDEEKNRISHRSKALTAILAKLS
ncbi:MAG: RdgB/HAM1 family non-canonical purine NTP pyrophosphatase [Clostridia bacterium]|nr:RdgB/HAM1 family non-canonical purine NTP pyrophosphatase [Clostridia bacterium]